MKAATTEGQMTRDKLEALIWQQLATAGCLPECALIDTILKAADDYRLTRLKGNQAKAEQARLQVTA